MIIKQRVNKNLSKELITVFFNGVSDLDLSYKELSELFRYLMCVVLNLDTTHNTNINTDELTIKLKKTLYKYNISKLDKISLLEECVHLIEISRKKVDNGII